MSRYTTCPECGHRMAKIDTDTYYCPWCASEADDEYDEDDESEESLSVYEAAEIWASHGKDEDYTFGYTEEELEDAL